MGPCDVLGKRCAAAGCLETVPLDFLMCRRHWRMLPAHLQQAVWTAYRAYLESPRTQARRLTHVQLEAIAAVNQKCFPEKP